MRVNCLNAFVGKVRPSSWNRKLDTTFNSKNCRNWKAEVKKKYYYPELSMQDLLKQRDKRVFVEQYMKLVAHWNSEKSKERSEKNKVARKQKIMNQTTGRRSFAQVQQKLAAMKELENQLPEDEDDQVGQSDIFSQIIGPDRPGRVCMLGNGVNPSDLWGEAPCHNTCNRIVMGQKKKLQKMDEQIRKQGQLISMLESKIFNQPNQNLGSKQQQYTTHINI
ncbi:uncharacterized protein [Henckelia pumila]|uniref:uncharacterized protein isoform X3 n=1 Tax=Henckelia pumila TaxID=405737 RepID=UPI003C6E6CFA